MNDAVITLNGLEKRFPGMDKPAVAPLDCTIHAGYVTGLVGPDGAGKTTLMRMLAGLLKPDSGSATVIGFDPIKNDAALHAVLGYMPQKFGLYEDLTVMENLNLYADLRSVTRRGTEANFCSPAGVYVSWPVYRTPGGQALRWDETKTWPGLYPGGRTESVAAR